MGLWIYDTPLNIYYLNVPTPNHDNVMLVPQYKD